MEVKIGEHTYRSGRIDARKQFHVARKIGPAYFAMVRARAAAATEMPKAVADAGGVPPELSEADVAKVSGLMTGMVASVSEALSQMSEEDADFVINTCLAVCERQAGNGWQKVMAGSGALMFEDIDVRVLIRLSIEVIKENLASFFIDPSGVMG